MLKTFHKAQIKTEQGLIPMQTSPQAASTSVPTHNDASGVSRTHADLIYQAVTVAAVLLLLGSLWVF